MAALSITAGNVLQGANARTQWGTAGATITQGQSVYLDAGTAKYKLAADTSATLAAAVGVSLNAASDGQPLCIQTSGPITIGATVTVGTIYGVGDAAGSIGPMSDVGTGEYVTVLGIATTSAIITLNIQASGVAVPA